MFVSIAVYVVVCAANTVLAMMVNCVVPAALVENECCHHIIIT